MLPSKPEVPLGDALEQWRTAWREFQESVGSTRYEAAELALWEAGYTALDVLKWHGEEPDKLSSHHQAVVDWLPQRLKEANEERDRQMEALMGSEDWCKATDEEQNRRIRAVLDSSNWPGPDWVPKKLPLSLVESGRTAEEEVARVAIVTLKKLPARPDSLLARVIVTVQQRGGRILRPLLHQMHRGDRTADPELSKLITPGGRWVDRGIGTIDGDAVVLGVAGKAAAEQFIEAGVRPLGEDG